MENFSRDYWSYWSPGAQTPMWGMGGCGCILSTEKTEEGLGLPASEGTLQTVTQTGQRVTERKSRVRVGKGKDTEPAMGRKEREDRGNRYGRNGDSQPGTGIVEMERQRWDRKESGSEMGRWRGRLQPSGSVRRGRQEQQGEPEWLSLLTGRLQEPELEPKTRGQ